jgi:predicted phosphatase
MTVGQAAGRSGRDPQHVALSSLAAFTSSAHIFSVIVDSPQPWQLLKRLLDVLGADLT